MKYNNFVFIVSLFPNSLYQCIFHFYKNIYGNINNLSIPIDFFSKKNCRIKNLKIT